MMKKYELKFTDKEGRTMSRIILGLLNLIDVIEREANEIEKYNYKVQFFETAIDETDITH